MPKKKLPYLTLILLLTYLFNICVPCIPVCAEAISLSVSSFRDLAGHWAEKEISNWTARGLAGGYPDGTFLPDSSITRAEFVALVNRVFGYTNMADAANGQAMISVSSATFRDIAETDWYAAGVAQAAAVGYIGGYPDGTVRPQNPITRQEVAVLLSRILPLGDESASLNGFTDQTQFPAWSKAAVSAAVKGGYMSGYPDGTFRPAQAITRAEAVAVLDRAVGQLYDRAGTYGPFQGNVQLEGNVTINTSGVTLQNTTITGNLYLTEGIGAGDVTLDNVTVQGTTKIAGGGKDSIQLRNTTLGAVLVNVSSHKLVRVLAQGDTAVGALEVRTPARLEEEGLTGSGFTKVVVNNQPSQEGTGTPENTGFPGLQATEPGLIVELLGNFGAVEVRAAAAQLALQKGNITNLNLASTAQGAQINLAAQSSINTVTADTPATIQGQGSVNMLEASVDGVVVEAGIISGETKKKKSRDAALSSLTIDGEPVPGFAPERLFYEIILSEERTTVPLVEATARHAKAHVTVTQATGLTAPHNTATVLVTAENGSAQIYTINFVKATVFGIAIKTAPTKTTYLQDESLDLSGLVIILVRTDNSTEEIAFAEFAAKGISTSPVHGTGLLPENNKVTIIHTASGRSVEQDLTVTPTYSVEVEPVSGGTADVTADKSKAKAGDTVTINITDIESGKKFKAITVTGASGAVQETETTEAGKAYTFTMPAEAVTVTVELEAIICTVTFDENGGEGEADPQTIAVSYGQAVGTLPTEPTREGYFFVGWNTESDGTGADFNTATIVNEDMRVYAKWVIAVTLNKTALCLQLGTSSAEEQLIAKIGTTVATEGGVTWESSNPDVATVDTDGKVTAVAVGETKITATAVDVDDSKEGICWVKVVASDFVIDDSCVLYLDGRMAYDSTVKTWDDLSGKENHGTLWGFDDEGSGWTEEGLEFDGEDDYVELQNDDSLNFTEGITIEAWIKPSDITGMHSIICKSYESSGNGYELQIYNQELRYRVNPKTQPPTRSWVSSTGIGLSEDEWQHVAVTYDCKQVKFYKDGVLINTIPVEGSLYDSDATVKVGVYHNKGEDFFAGSIRQVAVYNRALSLAEIAQNYFAVTNTDIEPVAGAILDLQAAEEKINLGTGIWQDASGENNHATLHNVTFNGDRSGLLFNGVNSYAEVAAASINNYLDNNVTITVESFVTFTELDYENNNGKLVTMLIRGIPDRESAHSGFALVYDNRENGKSFKYTCFGNSAGGYMGGGNNFEEVSREFIINKAYHFVVTINNKYATLFIDGEPVQRKQLNNLLLNSGESLIIGKWGSLYAPMEIHHLRIYNKALTDFEVLKNYLACLKS